eukprot:COSAG01_NODE_61132_length_291_cov_0.598958_1_plen_44_part_01
MPSFGDARRYICYMPQPAVQCTRCVQPLELAPNFPPAILAVHPA